MPRAVATNKFNQFTMAPLARTIGTDEILMSTVLDTMEGSPAVKKVSNLAIIFHISLLPELKRATERHCH